MTGMGVMARHRFVHRRSWLDRRRRQRLRRKWSWNEATSL
jgi:hypothetical protein